MNNESELKKFSIVRMASNFLFKNDFLRKKVKRNQFLNKPARKILGLLSKHYVKNLKSPFINTISLNGREFKILIDPRNGEVEQIIYFLNQYEPEISELIRKHSNKNKVFVDVGANVGYHSLYASFFFKEVIAFEPLPSVFNQFKESIRLNNFSNVTVHKLACSDKGGKSHIYYHRHNLGGSSMNDPKKRIRDPKLESIEIKTVTLDHFLKKTRNRIGLVKIDVEGHEPLVIEGMKEIIKKHKPIIITEFLPGQLNKIKQKQDIEFLETLSKDYELTDVEDGKKITDLKKYVKFKHATNKIAFANILLVPKKTD